MKNTIKLIVPLILGLIAGLFNYLALKSAVQEVAFVKAKRDIKVGEIFDESGVEKLNVLAKNCESLKDSAVLFSDLGLLSGQVATRPIHAGDIIFYRDTEGLQGEIYDFRQGDSAALPVSLAGITTPPKMRVGDFVELKIPLKSPPVTIDPNETRGNRAVQFAAAPPIPETKWIGPFRLVSVGEEISNNVELSESARISVAYDVKNQAMLDELEEFIDRSRMDDKVRLINIKLIR